jgi:3-oxoadipate enol-lactonase
MFDQGSGPPVVIIQGLHGRWEWMKPALQSLAATCRTISYSLCGDIGSGHRPDPALGFENYLRQLDRVLDAAGLERAALCGISFGGFVALRYAASRPARVTSLVLASAPAPGWKPNTRQARWIARPWLSAPVFVVSAPRRVWPEVSASIPRWPARLAFLVRQAIRAGLSPMIPSLMAARVHQAQAIDFAPDCRSIQVPTMILTGEEGLDRVVPVSNTRTFRTLIPGAELDTLERTGHLGCLTQPSRFAEVVSRFVHAHSH